MNLLRSTKAPQPNPLPQSARYLNELRALDVLFREGRMSRADLARALGLNRSTTGSIIANLLAEALVIAAQAAVQVRPRVVFEAAQAIYDSGVQVKAVRLVDRR